MKILVRLLFVICFLGLHAQDKKPFGNALWLTAVEKPSKDESKKAEVKLFNFNAPVSFESQRQYLKNKINFSRSYTLFVVYRDSADVLDQPVFVLKRGDNTVELKSDKIFAQNQIDLTKGKASNGFLLTAFNTNQEIKKSKDCAITFNEAFANVKSSAKIYEMLYFPKVLTKLERVKIESYLSLKYGISLSNRDYYNSKGEKIWTLKNNTGYLTRITGIARDDHYALDQKQSGNYLNDGLSIGISSIALANSRNSSETENLDYFIWSDNDKPATFNTKEASKGFEVFNRVWKVNQKMVKTHHFQISFDKKQMPSLGEDKLPYWLVQYTDNGEIDFSKATLLNPKVNNTQQLVFENVPFGESVSYFTIVRAPEFFADVNVDNLSCDAKGKSRVTIDMVGGAELYTVKISGESYSKEIQTKEKSLTLEGLSSGAYTVEITSGKSVYKNQFSVENFADNKIEMEKQYLLGDEPLVIVPKIEVAEDITAYQWFREDQLASTESSLTVNEAGNYKLVIQNKKGCIKESAFGVKSSVKTATGWSIYPNPAEAGQQFKIQFNFDQKKNVEILFHDLNGKLIKNISLGKIETYNYVDFMSKSGTYLVTVVIDGTESAYKLIIK